MRPALEPGLRTRATSECLSMVFSARLGVKELDGHRMRRVLCGLEPGHPANCPGSFTASVPLLLPFPLPSPLASANTDSCRDRDSGNVAHSRTEKSAQPVQPHGHLHQCPILELWGGCNQFPCCSGSFLGLLGPDTLFSSCC